MQITARINGLPAHDLKHNEMKKSIELYRSINGGDTGRDNCPIVHTFSDGIYCRQITIPKGVRLIGKIHKTEHINQLVTGKIKVIDSNGVESIKTAPCMWISNIGDQKAIMGLEDSIFQTFHKTDLKNPDDIENEITTMDYEDIKKLGVKQ